MKAIWARAPLLIALALCCAGRAAAEDGRIPPIIKSCESCHGSGGNSTTKGVPRLNGQSERYLQNRLSDLRDPANETARAVHAMWDIASHVRVADIADIARYFARQPAMSARNSGATAATGARTYLGYSYGTPTCAACHGTGGEGRGEAPRLNGQDSAYLLMQLKAYAVGTRYHAGMEQRAWSLSEKDRKALVVYLGATQGN